jgi:hypothetical protein
LGINTGSKYPTRLIWPELIPVLYQFQYQAYTRLIPAQKSVFNPGPDWYEVFKSAQYQDQDGMNSFECTQYQGLAGMFKSRYQTNSSEHQTLENFPFE